MKLLVKKYYQEGDYYDCKDEKGVWHRVDFHVCGSPEIKKFLDRETLIGKTVEVDDLQPYMELACNVIKVEEPKGKVQ